MSDATIFTQDDALTGYVPQEAHAILNSKGIVFVVGHNSAKIHAYLDHLRERYTPKQYRLHIEHGVHPSDYDNKAKWLMAMGRDNTVLAHTFNNDLLYRVAHYCYEEGVPLIVIRLERSELQDVYAVVLDNDAVLSLAQLNGRAI